MDIDNKLIICPNNVSKIFLSLRRKDPTLNFTVFDLKSLQRQLFGDYSKDAVNHLLQHTNYHLKDIQTELNYISRGINIQKSTSEIVDIYDIVTKNNLLESDDLIKELFKHHDVLVVGYSHKNLELQHLLKELDVTNPTFLKLKDVVPQAKPKLLQFKTIDEEIRYVLNSIIKENNEKLSKNESLTKKCIVCNTQDYEPYLKMYAFKYGIKLYFKNGASFKNTNIGKEMLVRAKELSEPDPFEFLDDLHTPTMYGGEELIDAIKQLIKDYLVCKDNEGNILKDENGKPNYVKNLYEALAILLENTKVKQPHFENEIIVTSSLEFNPSIEYYVLGASDSFLPSLSKNNDLLDDSVLAKLDLNTSYIKNLETEEVSEAFVNSQYVKHISYYQTKGKDNVFHTTFIPDDKEGAKKEDRRIIAPDKLCFDYSKEVATAYYSKSLDIEQKYKEQTHDLAYKDVIGKIEEYDSSFKGITQKDADRALYFSYSSMEQLYECPFKYFISHIMHMDEFKDNYGAKVGTFAHKVFENIGGLSFDDAWEAADNDPSKPNFNAKEKMLLHADKEILRKTYNELKTRIYTSGIANSNEHEYRKTYRIDSNNLYINGSIDNFIVANDGNIVIFDYKTGSFSKGNQNEYDNGLSLQLLIYSYMLSLDSTYKNNPVAGIYYCPVMPTILNRDSKEFTKKSKLVGLTYDTSVLQSNKDYIVSFAIPKEGEKTLSEQLANVKEKILEAEKIVRESEFKVRPTYVKKNTCKYCAFKDICFKSKALSDRPNLVEEEKSESKYGGEEIDE